jgi:hypothetical protein
MSDYFRIKRWMQSEARVNAMGSRMGDYVVLGTCVLGALYFALV